ncbi:hypothetical protein EGW08_023380 [Elysia chlorotica]|uniref:Uncharacterized protein n=1 Tax=Elysia chlorotica TaxID=188477 RepID=A0A3S0ZJH1_ELYCH|nr:hypothetical protein EGW08_023380 [Elysia chlorotica]
MTSNRPIAVCIGDYINNFSYSVSEMTTTRPLPALFPVVPFPDPYLQAADSLRAKASEPRWPCTMSKPEWKSMRPVAFYPRPRDWMHDWSEKMYKFGEFGAKQQK